MKTAEWYVPEYGKALIGHFRVATIEYVFDGAGYKIQVSPLTNGDVKLCELIVDTMNKRNESCDECNKEGHDD